MTSDPTSEPIIQKKSLSEQVFAVLESRIVNGALRPGSRLAEEAIAEEFGISRSPVREAIFELERVGLAERLGPRVRRVVTPTIEFISEIFDTWCILEIGRTYLSCIAAPIGDHEHILRLLELDGGNDEVGRSRSTRRVVARVPSDAYASLHQSAIAARGPRF